jgi:branched-chain amino acid transport system permease protein
MTYIDPTSFGIGEAILLLSMVIVGGSGNIKGPVVGALIVILVPEILKFLHMPDAIAANTREIIYGVLIIILMRFRPQGIAGEYRFV